MCRCPGTGSRSRHRCRRGSGRRSPRCRRGCRHAGGTAPDAVLLEHRLAELVHALGLLAPLVGGEVAVLEHCAGGGSRHISGMTTTCLPPTAAVSLATSSICVHTASHDRPGAGARRPFPPRASGCGRPVRRAAASGRWAGSRKGPARSTHSPTRRPRRGSAYTASARVVGEPDAPGVRGGSDENPAHCLTCLAFQLSEGRTKGRWIFFQSA